MFPAAAVTYSPGIVNKARLVYLTYKMAAILADDIFNCIFLNENGGNLNGCDKKNFYTSGPFY